MQHFWIWIYAALIVGGVAGFFLCAILSAGKEKSRVPVYLLDDVISWICQGDRDRTMSVIVHRVYGGKKHLHDNPVKRKAPAQYPASER